MHADVCSTTHAAGRDAGSSIASACKRQDRFGSRFARNSESAWSKWKVGRCRDHAPVANAVSPLVLTPPKSSPNPPERFCARAGRLASERAAVVHHRCRPRSRRDGDWLWFLLDGHGKMSGTRFRTGAACTRNRTSSGVLSWWRQRSRINPIRPFRISPARNAASVCRSLQSSPPAATTARLRSAATADIATICPNGRSSRSPATALIAGETRISGRTHAWAANVSSPADCPFEPSSAVLSERVFGIDLRGVILVLQHAGARCAWLVIDL